MISRMIAHIDNALLAFAKWRASRHDDESFYTVSMNVRNVSREEVHFSFLSAVDAKSSALLTHISIMIAFSIVLFESAKSNVYLKYLIGVEAVAYILLACLCLRCIRVLGPRLAVSTPDEYRQALKNEIIFRRELYDLTLNLVFVVTVLFAITFILNLFISSS